MTNPKTSESRAVASRAKAADDSPAPPNTNQDVVLQQLVSLAQSINALVQQNAAEEPAPSTPPRSSEELRVVFAYDFLGSVLGRRAPRIFQLRRVTVTRGFGELTFTELNGATAARIRSDRNVVVDLKDLRDGVAVRIDGANGIPDEQRIDSIIILSAPGGVPVAIGPCLGPVFGGKIADSNR